MSCCYCLLRLNFLHIFFTNYLFFYKLFIFIFVFIFLFVSYRKECFDSKWFGECLKVLFIPAEEVSQLQDFIKIVNGSPINFNMPPITT